MKALNIKILHRQPTMGGEKQKRRWKIQKCFLKIPLSYDRLPRVKFHIDQVSKVPTTTQICTFQSHNPCHARIHAPLKILGSQNCIAFWKNHVCSAQTQTKIPVPNPQNQSFSQSTGSVLPSSLTYFALSTRGLEQTIRAQHLSPPGKTCRWWPSSPVFRQ